MFRFLKRPEDVQNEFVAVERGKSLTNSDYMQCLFLVVLFSRKSYMNGNHWQTGGMEVVTFFVFLAFDALYQRLSSSRSAVSPFKPEAKIWLPVSD